MRYLINVLFTIVCFCSLSAQKNVHFIADYTRSEVNNHKMNGLSFGAEIKNKWQLTFDFDHGKAETRNLPSDFIGPELIAHTNTQSINLGRKLYFFPTDKVWFNTNLGIHKAKYRDFDNFEFVPRPEETSSNYTGIDLVDIIIFTVDYITDDYVSYTYELTNSDYIGLNGQLMFEGFLYKKLTFGIGAKFLTNKRTKEVSLNFKIGIRL